MSVFRSLALAAVVAAGLAASVLTAGPAAAQSADACTTSAIDYLRAQGQTVPDQPQAMRMPVYQGNGGSPSYQQTWVRQTGGGHLVVVQMTDRLCTPVSWFRSRA